MRERAWVAYAFMTPVVIVMAVIVVYPLIGSILSSFTDLDRSNAATVFQPGEHRTVRRRRQLRERPDKRSIPRNTDLDDRLDRRQRPLPLHDRPWARAAAQPAVPWAHRLSARPDAAVGGTRLRERRRVALHLQRGIRLPEPVPRELRDRRAELALRAAVRIHRPDHRQRLARRSVHDDRAARRHAVDSAGSLRGGSG